MAPSGTDAVRRNVTTERQFEGRSEPSLQEACEKDSPKVFKVLSRVGREASADPPGGIKVSLSVVGVGHLTLALRPFVSAAAYEFETSGCLLQRSDWRPRGRFVSQEQWPDTEPVFQKLSNKGRGIVRLSRKIDTSGFCFLFCRRSCKESKACLHKACLHKACLHKACLHKACLHKACLHKAFPLRLCRHVETLLLCFNRLRA
ncbi:Hypothetical protein SMAX5B_015130 [Scophthalmus maximus]|uniref:Uncharacterized protein n=1 Tax=Scophthalmus maximus TaxID=52904 RepID=A0A2U9CEP2_SCOMX|nr:Hypothetical protein SMAX5B_015130 [Scophthalmus maximus]